MVVFLKKCNDKIRNVEDVMIPQVMPSTASVARVYSLLLLLLLMLLLLLLLLQLCFFSAMCRHFCLRDANRCEPVCLFLSLSLSLSLPLIGVGAHRGSH